MQIFCLCKGETSRRWVCLKLELWLRGTRTTFCGCSKVPSYEARLVCSSQLVPVTSFSQPYRGRKVHIGGVSRLIPTALPRHLCPAQGRAGVSSRMGSIWQVWPRSRPALWTIPVWLLRRCHQVAVAVTFVCAQGMLVHVVSFWITRQARDKVGEDRAQRGREVGCGRGSSGRLHRV